MAPKAFDLASLTSSIPVINSGCVDNNIPTKSYSIVCFIVWSLLSVYFVCCFWCGDL